MRLEAFRERSLRRAGRVPGIRRPRCRKRRTLTRSDRRSVPVRTRSPRPFRRLRAGASRRMLPRGAEVVGSGFLVAQQAGHRLRSGSRLPRNQPARVRGYREETRRCPLGVRPGWCANAPNGNPGQGNAIARAAVTGQACDQDLGRWQATDPGARAVGRRTAPLAFQRRSSPERRPEGDPPRGACAGASKGLRWG